jgi:hypothetical protein
MRACSVLTVLVVLVAIAGCGSDKSGSPQEVTVDASFTVNPIAGTVITDFEFDASASSTSGDVLEFRWDWENDDTWDTGWSGLANVTHRYSFYDGTGIDTMEVRLEARSDSRSDTTVAEVVIDARHGFVLESFPTEAPSPSAMGDDGSALWLADWGAPGTGRLYKVNPSSGDTLYSIRSPDIWPCGVAWDGIHLCVTGYLKLRKIDPITGDVMDEFDVIYSKAAGGLAWDGESFYHGSRGDVEGADGRIHKYSSDGTHLTAFDAPHGDIHMNGLAFDGANLWVAVADDDSLYVLDPSTGDRLRAVHVTGQTGDVTVMGDHVWTLVGSTTLGRVVP